MSLVEEFHAIVDGYYTGSAYFIRVEEALRHYEQIMEAANKSSLAHDGMEMIEAGMREITHDND